MKLKNVSSRVLRFSRVVTAVLAVFLISTSISLYKSKTSPEIWLAVGALALVVIFVNGLLYRLLKKRPDSVNPLTIRQSFIVFLVISLLVALCRVLHITYIQWYHRPYSTSRINAFVNPLWFSSLLASQKLF